MAAHAFTFIWINPFTDHLLIETKNTWRLQNFLHENIELGAGRGGNNDILVQILSFYVLFNS